MMFNYLIDENLPTSVPTWNKHNFIHVSELVNVKFDTDIWQYALKNDLIIITKDTDFYYRCLASSVTPKVIVISAGNVSMKKFNSFIAARWRKAEKKLLSRSFIKLKRKK